MIPGTDGGRNSTAASADGVFADCARNHGAQVADLTASTAWAAFRDFAAVDLPAREGPDSDALVCQWGTFAAPGGAQFRLVLTRTYAVAVDGLSVSGGPGEFLQVDCRLTYTAHPALVALGRFESVWVPDGATPAASWLADVTARPEWAALAPHTPDRVEVTTTPV